MTTEEKYLVIEWLYGKRDLNLWKKVLSRGDIWALGAVFQKGELVLDSTISLRKNNLIGSDLYVVDNTTD